MWLREQTQLKTKKQKKPSVHYCLFVGSDRQRVPQQNGHMVDSFNPGSYYCPRLLIPPQSALLREDAAQLRLTESLKGLCCN